MSEIIWDLALIQKYNQSGPRYTSYPTALEFNEQYTNEDFIAAAQRYPTRPLSLYVHIPFCHKLCYFCACNKVITRHQHKADIYLDFLEREIKERSTLFTNRVATQVHWGGGTPTYLTEAQSARLMQMLRDNFNIADNAEISIEMDPREIELSMLEHLRNIGFNRISMGVQDFNKDVQKAVNREQDETFVNALLMRARELGFQSTNLDLIYGLPFQSVESFMFTLKKVIELNPDRLSVFNYAHLPSRFAGQAKIKDWQLPKPETKLEILQKTIETLGSAGYKFIGMDHFAKPDDELSVALEEGLLQRNFQGYSTYADCDLVAIGVSSIGKIGNTYSQNERDIDAYYAALDAGHLPIMRGYQLNQDDLLRRNIIQDLMCRFSLDYRIYESVFGIPFDRYFKDELADLEQLASLGLVRLKPHGLTVTPKGRFLIRNIAMVFDYHLRHRETKAQYSQTV